MSKVTDKNIQTLLGLLTIKETKIQELEKDLVSAKRMLGIQQVKIEQLNEQHNKDLYEKELMLADVDSIVQRSETIDIEHGTIDERD